MLVLLFGQQIQHVAVHTIPTAASLVKFHLILLISLNHSSFRLCLSLKLSFQKIKNESLDASVAYLQQK